MERRLAAILAADVVGYSRLMEADEEATVRTLSTYREIIVGLVASHHGRVFGSAGDSVIAEFASPVEAVRCAADIQRELEAHNVDLPEDRRMRLRIGVNLGDVIVEGDNLLGDGVNIAARLETLAEPGGISLARSVFDQVKKQLDLGYEYLGEHAVKNIAEPVPVYRVLTEPEAAGKIIGETKRATQSWKRMALAAVVFVLIGVAGAVTWLRPWEPTIEPASVERMAFPLPDKPSIAVLPFSNMSDDPSQDYFADGMTEDLITDLSKISGLFVIARNSSFSYKGQQVKVRQVAEDLGVRYVLEGSVRRAGDQVRINAQLIDATTGGHLWAERYDGALADVFALQDRVTEKIVSALAVKLTIEDRKALEHSGRPLNLDAYEYVLRGRAKLAQANRQATIEARKLFEKAIEADPKYTRAYVNLGLLHYHEWRYWGLDRDRNMARALELAREAITLADALAGAHVLLALVLQFRGEHEAADREADRVLSMGGLQAETLGNLGGYLRRATRYREAVDLLERAIRLDPLHSPDWLMWLGHSYLRLAVPEKAAAMLETGVKRAPDYVAVHHFLALSYAMLDRMEEARAQMNEVLRINPKFSIEAYVRYAGRNTRDRDALDREAEIMARIGFPAQSQQ
ncbi:MAG: adenylate/guanylate cyclase domain-containing protein [Gemmatimonadetes bacterium]|nr:adenylate/guanylate cyclase domain-containing protein [Gemmatimonadota bacterium]